jgi:heterodisulfide reductase subunit C
MNSADTILQSREIANYPETGHLYLSSILGQNLLTQYSTESLIYLERFGWWLHILVVFGFLVYLPYSKHLHIILAFPNTWYSSLEPNGKIDNMPEIEREVRSMLGLSQESENIQMDVIPEFGAKDIFDLKWKNILDAYSCTECGRCTSACPANITGKKLSPRKIMMDVRDRAEEIGRNLDSGDSNFIQTDKKVEDAILSPKNYNDGKSLFDYITPEEIHACTTCNACVEACPVMINPLDIIMQMRRHEILSQSAGPTEWLPMFNSLENMGAVWQMSEPRDSWTKF